MCVHNNGIDDGDDVGDNIGRSQGGGYACLERSSSLTAFDIETMKSIRGKSRRRRRSSCCFHLIRSRWRVIRTVRRSRSSCVLFICIHTHQLFIISPWLNNKDEDVGIMMNKLCKDLKEERKERKEEEFAGARNFNQLVNYRQPLGKWAKWRRERW